jgi:hypothetical protein
MAIAAMYAQAYLEEGPTPDALRRCVEAGVAAIPEGSGYARVLRDVLACHREDPDDWMRAWRLVEEKYGRDDRCPEGRGTPFNIDATVNGAYVVIGLLYGGGDFEKTLEISTRCGQDADCNPASAGGILGTLYGYERLPERFVAGIPALVGKKFAYTDYDVEGLLAASERVAVAVVERNGGRIEGEGDARVLVVPADVPAPAVPLEQLSDFRPDDLRTWEAEFDRRRAEVEGKR